MLHWGRSMSGQNETCEGLKSGQSRMRNERWSILNVKWSVLCVFWVGLLTHALCYGEAAILRLTYRNASEVLPIAEGLLTREGRAAVDVQSNSLVIVDTPESIRRVEAFLASLDQPVKQARIRVRLVEAAARQGSSVSGEGGISGENWRLSKGRSGGGVEIRAQDRANERRERSEYYIQATSGHWAYIAVGKDIPFTLRWNDLARRHGRSFETTIIRRIETGFDVRLVLMGDRADVEIVPRISHEMSGRRPEVIQFASASTRITVPLGKWNEIGSADNQGNEVMSAILEAGTSSRQSSLSMLLMVEAVS